MLDEDWGLRESELDDAEEKRRQRLYTTCRLRRGELESKETRYGFLANQVNGRDSEFQRLQAFTGMDSKFVPGEPQIVDEITNRFLEKERANTSLLRYLHEQQAEMMELDEMQKTMQQRRMDLQDVLRTQEAQGDVNVGEQLRAMAANDESKAKEIDAQLSEACKVVKRTLHLLW